MTIAQYKIRKYCKDNNISMHILSKKMGYSQSYLGGLILGKIPSDAERDCINTFFGIQDESNLIRQELHNKYRFASAGRTMFELNTGIYISYCCMVHWFRGRKPRDKNRLKALCKELNLVNEWVDNRYNV